MSASLKRDVKSAVGAKAGRVILNLTRVKSNDRTTTYRPSDICPFGSLVYVSVEATTREKRKEKKRRRKKMRTDETSEIGAQAYLQEKMPSAVTSENSKSAQDKQAVSMGKKKKETGPI